MDINEQINQLPNSELVQEVFDFVQSGGLLRGDASNAATAVAEGIATLVDGYEKAVRMAHSQEILFRYFMVGDGGAFVDVCWGNILDNELVIVNGLLSESNLMEKFDAIAPAEGANDFFKFVKGNLSAEYSKYLVEDVEGAMEGCIASRLASGRNNAFYERIFRVYQLGGWACGWDADNQRVYANFPETEAKIT